MGIGDGAPSFQSVGATGGSGFGSQRGGGNRGRQSYRPSVRSATRSGPMLRNTPNSSGVAPAVPQGPVANPQQVQQDLQNGTNSLGALLAPHGISVEDTDKYRYDEKTGDVQVFQGMMTPMEQWQLGITGGNWGGNPISNVTSWFGNDTSGPTVNNPTEKAAAEQQAMTRNQPLEAMQQFLAGFGSNLGLSRNQFGIDSAMMDLMHRLQGEGYDLSTREAQNSAAKQRAKLGLDADAIQNSRDDVNAQRGFADRWLGLRGQQSDVEEGRIGVREDDVGLDRVDLDRELARSQRQRKNQYAASGSWFTPENELTRRDLNSAHDTQSRRLDNVMKQLGFDRQSVALGRDFDKLSYDEKINALGQQWNTLDLRQKENALAQGWIDQDLALQLEGIGLQQAGSEAQHTYDAWSTLNQQLQNEQGFAQQAMQWASQMGLTPAQQQTFANLLNYYQNPGGPSRGFGGFG